MPIVPVFESVSCGICQYSGACEPIFEPSSSSIHSWSSVYFLTCRREAAEKCLVGMGPYLGLRVVSKGRASLPAILGAAMGVMGSARNLTAERKVDVDGVWRKAWRLRVTPLLQHLSSTSSPNHHKSHEIYHLPVPLCRAISAEAALCGSALFAY